jgi:hypothetical protein
LTAEVCTVASAADYARSTTEYTAYASPGSSTAPNILITEEVDQGPDAAPGYAAAERSC